MQLSLSAEEATFLRRVLRNRVSDLRMEIFNTGRYSLRKDLQRDEAVLKGIIDRLGEAEPSVGTALRVA